MVVICLLVGGRMAAAGVDPNEVGAILVFPSIVTLEQVRVAHVETFVTVTNAGPAPVLLHMFYVNGDDAPDGAGYCRECDFELELTGNDTETLVIRHGTNGIVVSAEDSNFEMSCPFPYGMLVVTQEDQPYPGARINVLTDNVLLGEQVVVDYLAGSAYSIPAVPIQGIEEHPDWRNYAFDDKEFRKLPRVLGTNFLAPGGPGSSAELILFTLGFERGFPPLADCSVTGFDAHENPFSASVQFGCWTSLDLCEISSEFCAPNLGLFTPDSHGWLQLNCRVDQDPPAGDGFEGQGGVHGAIVQHQGQGTTLAAGNGTPLGGTAAWARLLFQSVTTGDAVTLHMEPGF